MSSIEAGTYRADESDRKRIRGAHDAIAAARDPL